MNYIDVSFPYYKGMAIYPRNPDFSIRRVQDMDNGDSANVSEIVIGTHAGTHIDAPSHFVPGGRTIDGIPLSDMNGMARLLNLRGHCEITSQLLEGRNIESGEIVILKTDNSERFYGEAVLEDYVTLDYEAAEYLTEKKIKMVCIDYMTIERPRARRIQGKSVHSILLGEGILIAEALKLDNVDEGVYQMHCFPVNIEGADGAPVRIVLSELAG